MKNDWFLALCNPHNGIIHEFGYDSICNKTACICLKGCSQYEHFQKNNKHKFVNAREFYSVVGGVRQRFTSFEMDFKQVYLKRYINELKEAVANFEEYIMNDFLLKNPLIEIFCRYNSSATEMVQSVITDQLKDLQFAELRCKQVNHLKQFEQFLQQETQEDQQKRMTKLLNKVFQYYLRGRKLLQTPKIFDPRSLIDQQKIEDAATEMEKRLITMSEGHADKLGSVEELLIKISENMTDGKQDMDVYNKFYSVLERYMAKVKAEVLTLVVKSPLVQHSFWDKLALFLPNKGIKKLNVLTTCEDNQSKYLEKELGKIKSVQTRVLYCARWDQQKDEILPKK